MKNAKQRIVKEAKKNFILKLTGIFCNIVSSYLFIWALHSGEISKVNAVYQSMMIFSVLAGILILKEKQDIFKKLLGTMVTIIGVMLLI